MHTAGHNGIIITDMDIIAFSLASFTGIVYWLIRGDRDIAHIKQPPIVLFSGLMGFFLFRYLRDTEMISVLLSLSSSFLSGLAAQPFAILFIEKAVPAVFNKLMKKID